MGSVAAASTDSPLLFVAVEMPGVISGAVTTLEVASATPVSASAPEHALTSASEHVEMSAIEHVELPPSPVMEGKARPIGSSRRNLGIGEDGTCHPMTRSSSVIRSSDLIPSNPRIFRDGILVQESSDDKIVGTFGALSRRSSVSGNAHPIRSVEHNLYDNIMDSLNPDVCRLIRDREQRLKSAAMRVTEYNRASRTSDEEVPILRLNVVTQTTKTRSRGIVINEPTRGATRELSEDDEDPVAEGKGKRRARGNQPLQDAQEDEDLISAAAYQSQYNIKADLTRQESEAAAFVPSSNRRKATGATQTSTMRSKTESTQQRSASAAASGSKRTSATPSVKGVSSKVPKGGFLYDMMHGDNSEWPSGSDDENTPKRHWVDGGDDNGGEEPPSLPTSDSESSEESTDGQEADGRGKGKRARHTHKTKKSKSSKEKVPCSARCPKPSPYDGLASEEKYEAFAFESKLWVEMSAVPKKFRVQSLKRFLTGKASKWFMAFVTPDPKKYSMKKFYRELFNYCFPPDIKRRTRDRFWAVTQDNHGVRDFVRDINALANKLDGISDMQLKQRFWTGAKPYLRVKWSENGYDPEDSTFDELEEAALRFEQAHLMQTQEETKTPSEQDRHLKSHREKKWPPQ